MSEELKTYDFPVDHGDFTTTIELFYLKSDVDKVLAKLEEIQSQKMQLEDDVALLRRNNAELKEMAKEPTIPNRTCRKCGRAGTLMYMPIVKDGRIYWDLYNNKGIDYVFGIQCAHCGEVAFVTKQTHEYERRHHKYKRCLAMAKWCASRSASWCLDPADDELHKSDFYDKWKLRWLELAEKFKEGVQCRG